MGDLFPIVQGIIERGLIFGLVVAGVHFSSRLINFDNLSVEGAFGLSGGLTAFLLNNYINPWLTLLCAACIGGITGIITGFLNRKLKLNNLISGIVVTTGLFSVTLAIAGSNMVLRSNNTVFMYAPSFLEPYHTLVIVTLISISCIYIVQWLLTTEIGFLIRAVGDTPQMLTNIGKSIDGYTMAGLALSNMLAAISGSLFVQYTSYFSLWSSVGILIIGLAGMIIAELVSKNFTIALLIGSLIYQALIALTFELQLNQDWNKLVTALLIILLITIKNLQFHRQETHAQH